jgi:hypothetical protein
MEYKKPAVGAFFDIVLHIQAIVHHALGVGFCDWLLVGKMIPALQQLR